LLKERFCEQGFTMQDMQATDASGGPPAAPESGAGAEESLCATERWKQQASFYEAELARCTQMWEEKEQALLNEIDMRDAELNALEHRVRKATSDMEASEIARTEAVTRSEELEKRLSEASGSSPSSAGGEASAKPCADSSSDETERLRVRAQRAEDHVTRLGDMLASVCRQESQLVALLTSAREQLRQHGLSDDGCQDLQPKQILTNKTGQPQKQPLATNNTGVTDASQRVFRQQGDVSQEIKDRLSAREKLWSAAKEAASLENQLQKLPGTARSTPRGSAQPKSRLATVRASP